MTDRSLYHELIILDDRRRLVKRLYTENRFPEVTDLSLNELM